MRLDTPSDSDIISANENKNDTEEKTAGQLSKLQEALNCERDKRLEERFAWIFICIVLLDGLIFSHGTSWLGCLLLFLVEIAGLIILARRFGLEEIEKYLRKIEKMTSACLPTKSKKKKVKKKTKA